MVVALAFAIIITILVGFSVFIIVDSKPSDSKILKKKYREIDANNERLRIENARLQTKIESLETQIVARQLGLTWVQDTEE